MFVRQRRIDLIQRALSKILDEETWSPATPRRLHIGAADASSRGWTMIVPDLANFFLDRGGMQAPRLCRLAAELHCPAYEVDVRNATATTLFEIDPAGRMRISGSPIYLVAGLDGRDHGGGETPGLGVASTAVGFGMLPLADEIHERIRALHGARPIERSEMGGGDPAGSAGGAGGKAPRGMELADYLGALAGFPAWTRLDDQAIAAGELIYEPPRVVAGGGASDGSAGAPGMGAAGGAAIEAAARVSSAVERGRTTPLATAGLTARRSGTHETIARTTPRAVPASHDRKGTRPRSAARPRR